MIARPLALLLLLLGATSAAAQPALGETEFPNSGVAEAQEPFLRGLLLLHSFEYDDAREAFQEARQIDPTFAMAAWGEAMTHNHPIWMEQDRDAALAALRGLGAGWASAGGTERERAYLQTLAVLYGDGDKEGRDDAYAEAMRQLAERFPDDLDARSFYALALLGTAHEGRDFTTYMKAAAVAEEVFDLNPRHPGAAHYLIHAYDDPVHAPLGLRPARAYAEIAPSASHALHMPSHIYLALGMWDDVAEMNRRSYEAAKAGTDRRGLPLNGHGWHALYWWHYAATQQDDRALADRLMRQAASHYEADPSDLALTHLVRVRAHHALSTGDASAVAADLPTSTSLTTRAIDAYVRGHVAVEAGDTGRAQAIHDELAAALTEATDPPWTARTSALELEALLLAARSHPEAAVATLREAVALENAAPLTFGPPTPVLPTSEALGTILLDLGRAAEAAEAFEASLARAPGRRQSLAGLAAARAAADSQKPAAQPARSDDESALWREQTSAPAIPAVYALPLHASRSARPSHSTDRS